MRNQNAYLTDEKIELTLPVNSAYLSTARLTASSISNRMGFNIEDIEDIKAAVSEACVFFINQCSTNGAKKFHLEFNILRDYLKVVLKANVKDVDKYNESELGIKMIHALMDSLNIHNESENFSIVMTKMKK